MKDSSHIPVVYFASEASTNIDKFPDIVLYEIACQEDAVTLIDECHLDPRRLTLLFTLLRMYNRPWVNYNELYVHAADIIDNGVYVDYNLLDDKTARILAEKDWFDWHKFSNSLAHVSAEFKEKYKDKIVCGSHQSPCFQLVK